MTSAPVELRVYECPHCKCLVVHDGKPGEEIACTDCGEKRFVLPDDKSLSAVMTAMRDAIEKENA